MFYKISNEKTNDRDNAALYSVNWSIQFTINTDMKQP